MEYFLNNSNYVKHFYFIKLKLEGIINQTLILHNMFNKILLNIIQSIIKMLEFLKKNLYFS